MKLIAKAPKGAEFFHSRKDAFFAPDSSADKIRDILIKEKFRLKNETETWHVYDFDWMQQYYVTQRLSIYRGVVRIKSL